MEKTIEHYLWALGIDPQASSPSRDGLDLVRKIHQRHVTRFTFNNLAVLLQQPMPLSHRALYEKIVAQRRGGYCFEHNKLAFDVLQALGFDVRPLLARVVYRRDGQVPHTHRVTLLTIDGARYIVDVGFGRFGPRLPVELDSAAEQDQGDNCYRIKSAPHDEHCLQILRDGVFSSLYTFDLRHSNEADCAVAHFYSHKHPEAAFVNNLVVCRRADDHTLFLRNGEIHRLDGQGTRVERITSAEHMRRLLVEDFDLDVDPSLPDDLFRRFGGGVPETNERGEAQSKIRVYCALSLDGFIAGPNDDLSWLGEPDGDQRGDAGTVSFQEMMEQTGAILMGRRTFDVVMGMGRAWPYGAIPTLVATSRPLTNSPQTVSACCGDIRQISMQAKEAAGGKDVYVDGGDLISQALDAGCVDELILTIVPVLLGQGVPLYQGKKLTRFAGEHLGRLGEMMQIKMIPIA